MTDILALRFHHHGVGRRSPFIEESPMFTVLAFAGWRASQLDSGTSAAAPPTPPAAPPAAEPPSA